MKEVVGLNLDKDGCSRTLVSTYYKRGAQDVLYPNGGFYATGVLEFETEDNTMDNNTMISNDDNTSLVGKREYLGLNLDKDGCARCVVATYYKRGASNVLEPHGGFYATGVIEYDIEEDYVDDDVIPEGAYFIEEDEENASQDIFDMTSDESVGTYDIKPDERYYKSISLFDDETPQENECKFETPQQNHIDTIDIENNGVNICQAVKKGYIFCPVGGVFDTSYENSILRRGRVQGGGKISPTLTSSSNNIWYVEKVWEEEQKNDTNDDMRKIKKIKNVRMRKLTERECFRLMGVEDKDIDKLLAEDADISMTRLYQMAGNSIVVDVLAEIWRTLLIEPCSEKGQTQALF